MGSERLTRNDVNILGALEIKPGSWHTERPDHVSGLSRLQSEGLARRAPDGGWIITSSGQQALYRRAPEFRPNATRAALPQEAGQ